MRRKVVFVKTIGLVAAVIVSFGGSLNAEDNNGGDEPTKFLPLMLPKRLNVTFPDGIVELSAIPDLKMRFSESNDAHDDVAQRCYASSSDSIMFCVFAVKVLQPKSSTDNALIVFASNEDDCRSGIKTIRNVNTCYNYRVTEAYYDWFRLYCRVKFQCNSPDTCDRELDTKFLAYYLMSTYSLTPYAGIMVTNSADRSFFLRRCRDSKVYRLISDRWDCDAPPIDGMCDLFRDRNRPTTTTPAPTTTTAKPTTTTAKPTTTTAPPPTSPTDPSCLKGAKCEEAVGIESNLLPNYCDCHRFWQCQPKNVYLEESLRSTTIETDKWFIIPKICAKRDETHIQYFNIKLKVCKNHRDENVVDKCEN